MTTEQTTANQERTLNAAASALTRYRVMAIITGVMLLLLCVEMFILYGIQATHLKPYIAWIPFAHGWIYVVYLITVVDLWIKMRWNFKRLVSMVLAGVVPVLSFFVEAKVTKEARARIAAARALIVG